MLNSVLQVPLSARAHGWACTGVHACTCVCVHCARPGYSSRHYSFSPAGQASCFTVSTGTVHADPWLPSGSSWPRTGGLFPSTVHGIPSPSTRPASPTLQALPCPAHLWLQGHFIHAVHTPSKPSLLAEDFLLVPSPSHLNCA